MTPINTTMGWREWAMLATLSLMWGASFFFSKLALAEVPPLTIVLMRVALAALALRLVLLMLNEPAPRGRHVWKGLLIMGLLNNMIPFSLIFWAQTHMSIGLAAILNATTPFFALILAHIFTRDEKLRINKLAGIFLGIAGVAILVSPDAIKGMSWDLTAKCASLLAAFTYGCAVVYTRYFHRFGLSAMQTAYGQLTVSSLLMLPVAAIMDDFWTLEPLSIQVIAALAALAIISTALAYILFFALLKRAGATNAALVTLLVPVTATLLAALFLNEDLHLIQILGFSIIAAGFALIDGRVIKHLSF